MKTITRIFAALAFCNVICIIPGCAPKAVEGYPDQFSLSEGQMIILGELTEGTNFKISGKALTSEGALANIGIATNSNEGGYDILFHNGPIDGTIKTGSLVSIRNLYKSLSKDGEWFDFDITVRKKNISISINGECVVSYTEPENPFRLPGHENQVLGSGETVARCIEGKIEFKEFQIKRLSSMSRNREFGFEETDESNDGIIALQQINFPVIDYHVHLKGGLTKELAHKQSLQYGINYGIAPNAGEGGVGRMLANDEEVYAYFSEVKDMPFLCGVQGEGRKWPMEFSADALGIFDYLFTDAMTIVDHNGRIARIYRPEEVVFDDIDKEGYMDRIVDQTVAILSNEPSDIFANPTFIPDEMNSEYDRYWTDERVDRVLDVLEKNHIALEINARYRIPSMDIIRKAKQRGIKFTFGTNNVDADFGRLEYCLQAVEECGLTPGDIWFPAQSIRKSRPTILYNTQLIENN